MKTVSYIGLILGLAVLTALIAWQGIREVGGIMLASGVSLLLVPLIWVPTVLPAVRAWQLTFRPDRAPGYWPALYAHWMGVAVNTLLPVASIGGEVVKTRVLVLKGIDPLHASASLVVDKTVQVFAMILWGVVGVVALSWLALDNKLAAAVAAGLALLGVGVTGFLVVQHSGMLGFMARSANKVVPNEFFSRMVEHADDVDQFVTDVYRRRRQIAASTLWRFVALALQTGEVWLAAFLLGHPIGIVEAVMLKSLSNTLSDAAFFVPNSYGVQEGAYVVLGGLIGIGPDVALAISLATRLKELLFDVPGLMLWQHVEWRTLVLRRKSAEKGT